MAKSVYLYLPGILHPKADWAARMPSLSYLISKSDSVVDKKVIDSKLNYFFDLESCHSFPYAALGAFAEGLYQEQSQTPYWIHADPVLLQAGPQGVFLQEADEPFEAEQPFDIEVLLQDLFLPYQMQFFTRHQRGYLNLPNLPDISTNSLKDVIGKNIHQRLPSGPDAAFWNRLLTECQMLFKAKSDRHPQQMTSINSLWFWGEGALPSYASCSFEQLVSDEPFVKGLADLSHTSYSTLEDWLALSHKSLGKTFILTFAFDRLLQEEKYELWGTLASDWENRCFKPVLKALQQGEIDKISIDIGQISLFQIKQRHLYYFWRRQLYDSHSDHSI